MNHARGVHSIKMIDAGPFHSGCGTADTGETMLERWNLQYSPHSSQRSSGSDTGAARASPSSVYKRMVIALRALYSYVRVLPAYRLHRACKVYSLLPSVALSASDASFANSSVSQSICICDRLQPSSTATFTSFSVLIGAQGRFSRCFIMHVEQSV